MTIGTVKWFDATKGYGFIAPEEGDKDVFVHISAVQASGLDGLAEGDKLSFELEEQKNGKKSAVNLEKAVSAYKNACFIKKGCQCPFFYCLNHK